jgi:DNA adenine methylase
VALAVLSKNEILSPPLKWAGGKRWLVPMLKDFWQSHRGCRLVEPFVGGMAVALAFQPQQALMNDRNPHLINFYRWLQRGLSVEIPLQNDSNYYYDCRQRFNELILAGKADSAESAQLFYFMNRTGFNGLCRFNAKDQFNVPFGRYKTINYLKDFSEYTANLKNWTFSALDFAQLSLTRDDFIYADPPYDVEFTQYSANTFKWQDQVRLAEWLTVHPGPVVASNQATDRIVDLYRDLGFSIQYLAGPRRIACNGDRAYAGEILASRNV